MIRFLHLALIAVLLVLPIAQASSWCCLNKAAQVEQDVEMAMPCHESVQEAADADNPHAGEHLSFPFHDCCHFVAVLVPGFYPTPEVQDVGLRFAALMQHSQAGLPSRLERPPSIG